jgi:AcrR family transcriptional regulator
MPPDLPRRLLAAARAILDREGLDALTLRAAARAVGVSHAAPKNHFDDMTGLLSELAATGFREFAQALQAAGARAVAGHPFNAIGEAYVAFAERNPAMFLLMFRSERLDMSRPALREAVAQARDVLARGAAERLGGPGGGDRLGRADESDRLESPGGGDRLGGPAVAGDTSAGAPAAQIPPLRAIAPAHIAAMVRSWSLVHGFAMLLIDGRLTPVLGSLPQGSDWRQLLAAVFGAGPGQSADSATGR